MNYAAIDESLMKNRRAAPSVPGGAGGGEMYRVAGAIAMPGTPMSIGAGSQELVNQSDILFVISCFCRAVPRRGCGDTDWPLL